LSIEERYRHHGQYVSRVARAADRLVRQRFLLEEDAQAFIKAAAESDIGK
jgi:response regulator RpfG family c-di-GMP phosphodiesterase